MKVDHERDLDEVVLAVPERWASCFAWHERDWHVDQSGLEDTGFEMRLKSSWPPASNDTLTSRVLTTPASSWSRTERPAPAKNVETPCNRMGFAITAGPEKIVLTRLAKKVRFPVLSQERQSWLLAKDCIEMNMKPFWLRVFSGRLNPDKNNRLDLNQMNGNSCEINTMPNQNCSVDWQDDLC